jgi:PAS domain S-box-containing protein
MIKNFVQTSTRSGIAFHRLASLIAAGMGILVLIGWTFQVPLFTSMLPDLVPMHPLVAVCFITAAISLGIIDDKNDPHKSPTRLVGQALSALIIWTGGLKLAEVILGWSQNLDQLFVLHRLIVSADLVARPVAPLTSVNLLLLGHALFLLHTNLKNRFRVIQCQMLVIGFICLLALVGYVYQIRSFTGIGTTLYMALNTTLIFILLAIGILWLYRDRGVIYTLLSKNSGGIVGRNLLPIAIALPLILGEGCLEVQKQFGFSYELCIGITMVSIIFVFACIIYWNAKSLNYSDQVREEMEGELRQQKKFSEAISFASPDFIYVFDLVSKTAIYSNRENAAIVGWPVLLQEPNIDSLPAPALHRSHTEAVNAHFQALLRLTDKEVKSIEYQAKNTAGIYRWLSERNAVFAYDHHGKPTQILGWIQDITEAKEAELRINELLVETQSMNEELLASQEDLRIALDHTLSLNQQIAEDQLQLIEYQRIAGLGNWEYDLASGIISWSEETFRIFGQPVSEGEPAFMDYLSLFHPGDQEPVKEAVTKAVQQKASYEMEIRLIHPDRSVHYTQMICKPIVNAEGKVIKLRGVVLDINERKQAEQAIRESENKYRELVETSNDLIWSIDATGGIIFINHAVQSILGYEPEEVIGRHFTDFQTTEQAVEDNNVFDRLIQGEKQVGYQTTFLHKDGTVRHFAFNSVARQDEQGKISGIGGIGTDITEQKKAEVAVLNSKNFLDKILSNIPSPVFVKDRQHRWIMVNDAWCEFLGQPAEAILGKSDYDFFSPEEADVFWEKDEEVFTSLEDNTNEEKFTNSQGVTYDIITKKSVYTDLLGEQLIVGVTTDISGLKHFEEQLKAQNEELKKINAELDRFVYRASHDLRAPLSSVLGLINIARVEEDEQEREHYFNLMVKSIDKLDGFIQSIIHYSRNARLEVAAKLVDFNGLVEETYAELKYMQGSERVQKEFHIRDTEGFFSDEFRLKTIFTNIVSNAIRYSSPQAESFIKICIAVDKHRSVIEFVDNGLGIAAESIDKIFDMFYRASQHNAGSGLGLYIVKEVVNTLGGTINVTSTLGVGTTFRVEIPNIRQQEHNPVM